MEQNMCCRDYSRYLMQPKILRRGEDCMNSSAKSWDALARAGNIVLPREESNRWDRNL